MKIKRLIGGNLESNGYILYAQGTPFSYIIDPGYLPQRFLKELSSAGLKLEGILLTHHHYDHVGAVDVIAKTTGCPVYLHRGDCDMYGGPVTNMLSHGDSLPFSEEEIRVLHTPGHTKGSVCFYCEKSKVCFTGDTIFDVDLGRTDLKDGSEWEMRESVRSIIDLWGNDITIYPGHGDPATMKYVRKYNREFLELLK